MSEAEVVAVLVEFTNILLAGVSVFFTVVSAYIAALNYFIGSAGFIARLAAFLFVSFVLAMLAFVMLGAQFAQQGLIDRLHEIADESGLSAAGRAMIANAAPEAGVMGAASIDDVVVTAIWGVMGFTLVILAYLTFLYRWSRDAIAVSITEQA
ncbi:MAG: hypothetical protein NW203_03295 [Hyphomonadaceae bacterium]|nr:hypothetical protein [Hyphomonadaceae bacterium]